MIFGVSTETHSAQLCTVHMVQPVVCVPKNRSTVPFTHFDFNAVFFVFFVSLLYRILNAFWSSPMRQFSIYKYYYSIFMCPRHLFPPGITLLRSSSTLFCFSTVLPMHGKTYEKKTRIFRRWLIRQRLKCQTNQRNLHFWFDFRWDQTSEKVAAQRKINAIITGKRT